MLQIRWIEGAVLGLVLLAGLSCESKSQSGGQATVTPTPPPSASSVAVSPAAPTAPPQMVGADDSVNEELRNYHRHHHGGVAMFITMAIDTLGLDEAKKASVAKIQSDLRAKMAPTHDADRDLLAVIADGVSSGKIDTAKVDAAVEKVAVASYGIHAATSDALTQLHDTLAPAERAALVDKVRAHWEVWHKVNVDEKMGSKEKGARLAKLSELLGLTADQVDKISAALAADAPIPPKSDPKTVDAHIQAFATAFLADKFDAKSLMPSAAASAGHVARHGGARLVRFYQAVTPVLTPQQRTVLAAHVRERLDDDQVVN